MTGTPQMFNCTVTEYWMPAFAGITTEASGNDPARP
jgi:hypothetical protein